MALLLRTPFDIEAPLVARKELREGPSVYLPGELFPWKKLGFSEIRVRQLWSAMQIEVAGSPTGAMPVEVAGKRVQAGAILMVSLGGGVWRRATAEELAEEAAKAGELTDGAETPPARPAAKAAAQKRA